VADRAFDLLADKLRGVFFGKESEANATPAAQ
jgi:hypothetical protein